MQLFELFFLNIWTFIGYIRTIIVYAGELWQTSWRLKVQFFFLVLLFYFTLLIYILRNWYKMQLFELFFRYLNIYWVHKDYYSICWRAMADQLASQSPVFFLVLLFYFTLLIYIIRTLYWKQLFVLFRYFNIYWVHEDYYNICLRAKPTSWPAGISKSSFFLWHPLQLISVQYGIIASMIFCHAVTMN